MFCAESVIHSISMDQNIRMFSLTRELFPAKRDFSGQGICQRHKPFKANSLAAIKFLSLREQGETFKRAIDFSTRRHCRYDNTQLTDGTTNFRIFKRKQVKVLVISERLEKHLLRMGAE